MHTASFFLKLDFIRTPRACNSKGENKSNHRVDSINVLFESKLCFIFYYYGCQQTFVSFYLLSHVTGGNVADFGPPSSDKITDIEALEAFGDTIKNN